MNTMIKRNLKLFFRDRTAVFFSLLAVLIVVGLYAVFLGNVMMAGTLNGLKEADNLMNNWLAAGLLAVASVTTTLGAFGVMIDDKTKKINKDFSSSPIKNSSILAGYLGSSFLIGVIMSVLMAALSQIYIIAKGGVMLPLTDLVLVFLLILLTTLMNTSIICFVVSFFKSHSAFSTASTIIGTLIGFLTGIYVPIGRLPETVQTVVKLFPVSYAAALFRQVFMKDAIATSFNGVPIEAVSQFKQQMGITYFFGNTLVTPLMCIFVLLGTAVLFYALTLARLSSKRN